LHSYLRKYLNLYLGRSRLPLFAKKADGTLRNHFLRQFASHSFWTFPDPIIDPSPCFHPKRLYSLFLTQPGLSFEGEIVPTA
jgi:hypothetical protein